MATLALEGIVKRYGPVEIVHGIDLAVADGEFMVLVGPSGCGKSTLLRMVAGLETISGGELRIGGRRANELPPQRRNISMVFQSYALFPHLSVFDNVAFGPRMRGDPRPGIAGRVEHAAQILGLMPYLKRRPRALSGGQRQRVAMGRALVRDPDLFLFDEPLSNLDAHLRVRMRTEIRALQRRLGTTTLYVTHDQVEAMTMADRVAVLADGRIEQVGTPLDLYDRPETLFVAGFLGSPAMGLIRGMLRRDGAVAWVEAADGTRIPLPGPTTAGDGRSIVLGIRPEQFRRSDADAPALTVAVVEPLGLATQVTGDYAGTRLTALFRERLSTAPGHRIPLLPASCHLFDAVSGRRVPEPRA